MGTVRVVRADALARSGSGVARHSTWGHVTHHAEAVGARAAVTLDLADGLMSWTWADLALGARRAAAGLMRTGLRADQVVLSLLPGTHGYPELEVALRAIGAVSIVVDEEATAADVARALDGADVHLVVVESAADLDRVRHLAMPSARLLALGDDGGWQHLLALGAERLRMDPDAVDRADAVVDPAGATPRILRAGSPLVSTPTAPGLAERLSDDDVVLLVGADSDPFVGAARDAHLESGCTLVRIPDATCLQRLAGDLRPAVVMTSTDEAAAVVAMMSVTLPVPRRRAMGAGRRGGPADWWGSRVRAVVTTGLPEAQQVALRERGVEPVLVPMGEAGPADLPVAPEPVVGDVRDLPRRARRDVGSDFALDVDRAGAPPPAPDVEEVEDDVVLPSLSLFSGESFLDKLLLARAAEART